MRTSYRLIEYGGKGARRIDYSPGWAFTDSDITFLPTSQINDPRILINFAIADLPARNDGIGYSVAGFVAPDGTLVKSPNNRYLVNAPLGTETRRLAKRRVFVANDLQAAVVGMAIENPDLRFFMGKTWSSGIGQAFYVDGRVIPSEAGHMSIFKSPHATLCGCGQRGCLESIAGGERIARRVIEELRLHNLALPAGKHPCAYLDECFAVGQEWARQIYESVCAAMGQYLAIIRQAMLLPALVWKGSFALKGVRDNPTIQAMIRKSMRQHLQDPNWEKELKFRFVRTPPEVSEDHESYIGLAKLVEEQAT